MKKKTLSFLLICFGFLFFPLIALHAGSFPNDAKEAFVDKHSTASGILLASSTNVRTVLYAMISCAIATGDKHITIGDPSIQPNVNNILDTEGSVANLERFIWKDVKAGDDIYWEKSLAADDCNYRIIYTDYRLASSTSDVYNLPAAGAAVYGSSTPMTMISNIENVGYIATTTIINGATTFTAGVYTIPFNLFKYMAVLFFATLLIVVLSLYFLKSKKNAN